MPATTLGAMACTLALAGCGGGGSSSKATTTSAPAGTAATTTTTTKAKFIAQADAICGELRRSLRQVVGQGAKELTLLGDTPRAFDTAATLFRRVQSLERGELRRLRGLRLPNAGTSAVRSYLQQGARAVSILGRLADLFSRREKAAVAAAERDASLMAATTKGLAQGYGFKVCGSGPGGNGLS